MSLYVCAAVLSQDSAAVSSMGLYAYAAVLG